MDVDDLANLLSDEDLPPSPSDSDSDQSITDLQFINFDSDNSDNCSIAEGAESHDPIAFHIESSDDESIAESRE